MKPKVAVFSFTGCEGCSLAILECEHELLDLLQHIEFVNFREAMTEKRDDYDIALMDGSLSTPHDVEKAREIRSHAKLVVAIGACAHTGGVNAIKNRRGPLDQLMRDVYGEAGSQFRVLPAMPVSAAIPVDFAIPGCPISSAEFLEIVKDLLQGKTPKLPNYPVCVECKRKGNVCLYDQERDCMGVVARAGCDAICPTFGDPCEACRGYVDDPNTDSHQEVLRERGLTVEQVLHRYTHYNAYDPETDRCLE